MGGELFDADRAPSRGRPITVHGESNVNRFPPARFVRRRCDVKQKTTILATTGLLLILAGCMFAQGVQSEPAPALPSSVLGPDLIAWSQMQTPRPVPQPLPPDQNPPAPQQPTTETLAGTIMKVDSSYVLKLASGLTYRLDYQNEDQNDDQNNARRYEGKQIQLLGSVDANRNSIHILGIQLIS